MKRHGQLMAKIADAENLRLAFWKAAKGKRGKADCRTFQARLSENLSALGAELMAGSVPVGDYHYFKVRDPKERLICAAKPPKCDLIIVTTPPCLPTGSRCPSASLFLTLGLLQPTASYV